jgi:hypothetical protein
MCRDVCVPEVNVVVVNFATPLLTVTWLEICVDPSKNATLPVAAFGLMVAVNVAAAPVFTLSSGVASESVLGTLATF